MNLEEMKKLYESEPDKWVVYFKTTHSWKYFKGNNPKFGSRGSYKLIRKDHEAIADAVTANPDVEVEWKLQGKWTSCTNSFFSSYHPESEYQLKPQPMSVVMEDASRIYKEAVKKFTDPQTIDKPKKEYGETMPNDNILITRNSYERLIGRDELLSKIEVAVGIEVQTPDFSEVFDIIRRNGIDTGSPTDPLPESPDFNGGYIKVSQSNI